MSEWSIITGEVSAILSSFQENSFDALLADPPYGIRMMGKKWDYDVPSVFIWEQCLRVLKPGAPILVFGGCRTYHRMVVNIEDAGFEICDQIDWIFAKGMPHPASTCDKFIDKHLGADRKVIGTRTLSGNAAVSTSDKGGTYGIQVGSAGNVEVPVTEPATDLAKQWQDHGVALSPAHEPICLACKPYDGSIAANIDKWGVGGWWIGGCRIGQHDCTPEQWAQKAASRNGGASYGTHKPGGSILPHKINRFTDGAKPFGGGAGHPYETVEVAGRWPKNLLLDEAAGQELDRRIGPRQSRRSIGRNGGGGRIFGGSGSLKVDSGFTDSGGPSRFFYSVKVSKAEREFGCEDLPLRSAAECTDRKEGLVGSDRPQAGAGRSSGARNYHPTLKPISLTTYLSTLLLPARRDCRLLVPFSGAGSEMIGALESGWGEVVGVEQDEGYCEIARRRIKAYGDQ